MTGSSTILQIVPRLPGTQSGVADYASILAARLRDFYSCETAFATAESALTQDHFDHVVLHYVNYGYQKRGVPFGLLSILREVRRRCSGRMLTIFHELYASGPPWKSAFWLRPFQAQIAKAVAQISDTCIVSSETMRNQLAGLMPAAKVSVHPVVSNFGEPSLSRDQLANRSPHRWVICGGTVLVERALRSFRPVANSIPEHCAARELFVIGGNDNPAVRALLTNLADIRTEYHPQIAVADASQILSTCSFAWFDYFHRADVPSDVALKSGVLAAICAHGIIPIFPHRGSTISVGNRCLPGPFFVDRHSSTLPEADERTAVALSIHDWYRHNSSSENLARGIADTLFSTPVL